MVTFSLLTEGIINFVFDMSGKFVTSSIHCLLQQPHGLGVNIDGNLVISCWANHIISIFSTGCTYLEHFGGSNNGKFDRRTGLAILPKIITSLFLT